MFLPRIIPILTLKGKGLVKTIKFKNSRYIGDPINAVKIFNELQADELIFLDITASKENRSIEPELVRNIGDEAFMPFGIGGGINKIKQAEEFVKAGAEKLIINTYAILNPSFIRTLSNVFGSQSIVISIDVKKSLLGKYEIWVKDGTLNTKKDPVVIAKEAEQNGAGELIINSINLDGTMKGYDINLLKIISNNVRIPVVACGGAGSLLDLKKGYNLGNVHALAAGSLFVYHGARNAVLINYPTRDELKEVFF